MAGLKTADDHCPCVIVSGLFFLFIDLSLCISNKMADVVFFDFKFVCVFVGGSESIVQASRAGVVAVQF